MSAAPTEPLVEEAPRSTRRVAVLLHGATRALLKPLTLAQILSSAAGAVAMVIAAAAMRPDQFSVFALLTLASATMTGLLRAALLQPALIHRRQDTDSFVPFRYALLGAAVASMVLLGVAVYLNVRGQWSLVIIAVSAAFPALYDWLRFQAMGQDRRWPVALGDGLRLAMVLVVLGLPSVRSDAVALQAWLSFGVALPGLLLLWRLPRIRVWLRYRSYARSAGWQLVDFLFGQTLITVPLLVLGGAGGAGLISGLRLAQAILGPLNLVFSAGVTNLVADGATRKEFSSTRSLLARGSALARLLSLTSIVCVTLLLAAFALSPISLRGVSREDIIFGLIVIGASLVTTGWSGVHAVVLRLLGYQASVTVSRAVISAITVAGFVVGFVLGGTDASLIAGFAALTVSTPLVFGLVSRSLYAKARSTDRLGGSTV